MGCDTKAPVSVRRLRPSNLQHCKKECPFNSLQASYATSLYAAGALTSPYNYIRAPYRARVTTSICTTLTILKRK